jgi:GT2 family glycosyltransferase
MDVSVIIVNYKTAELTIQSVESVKKFTKEVDYEIIVVDNASADGSLDKIRSAHGDIQLISNAENIGFGRANNIGINLAKGKYVFLLNSDAFLTNNAILIFKNFMEAHADAGVCGGNLITGRDDETVSYGNLPTIFENFSAIGFFVFYKKYFMKHIASGIVNRDLNIKKVGYINGADMFIRKSVLNLQEAFDKDFFMYFEETELSYRILKSGFYSYIVPEALIIHLVGGSQDNTSFNYFKYSQYFKGKRLYFKKTQGNFSSFVIKVLSIIMEIALHSLGKSDGQLKKKMSILIKN